MEICANLGAPRPGHPERKALLTSAEFIATLPTVAMAAALAAPYVADHLGLGVLPWAAAGVALASVAAIAVGLRDSVRVRVDETIALVTVVAAALIYLLWLAWPALLPLGSGSDLTHHLLLIDYIERHGQLPHDASAVAFLGEMAHYTPGLHLLAAMAGSLARVTALHAVYPIVVLAVALKLGVFLLVLLRLLQTSPFRLALAVAGTLAVLTVPAYSLGSFVDDSFLAQVVAELFAVFGWWTLVMWDAQPNRQAMGLFAIAGIAVFLTWPISIGPPVLTLAILVLMQRQPPVFTRLSHAATALVPIGAFVLLHAAGRAGQASIVGTSGAVVPPSTANLGWWLPPLSLAGAITLIATRRQAGVTVLAGAIGAQAAGLWLVAAGQTPYMAIKMTYLAIYPAIACAIAFVDRIANIVVERVGPVCGQERESCTRHGPHSGDRPAERAKWTLATSQRIRGISRAKPLAGSGMARRAWLAAAWSAAVVLAIGIRDDLPTRSNRRPVVSEDLAAAGLWARAHVPVDCIDYLVGNEYTAYWLHLAVLGNPRISTRTGDDATFLTQPSMERWLVPGGLRYAIANLAILPAEIRREVDVVHQAGQAAVIERRGRATCPAR